MLNIKPSKDLLGVMLVLGALFFLTIQSVVVINSLRWYPVFTYTNVMLLAVVSIVVNMLAFLGGWVLIFTADR